MVDFGKVRDLWPGKKPPEPAVAAPLEPGARRAATIDYGEKCVSKQSRMDFIQACGDAEALRAVWQTWEGRGVSREGQLYAAVQRQLAHLGEPADLETAQRVEEQALAGKKLPPIQGSFRR
jgi:hypothetical protein